MSDSAEDIQRREQLAVTAAALAGEVKTLNAQLVDQTNKLTDLTARNDRLSERATKHSWWIYGTVAGLLLDVALTVVILFFYDTQSTTLETLTATNIRLENSIKNQCGFLSLVLGGYNPESRAQEDRPEYEQSFRLMRLQYKDLGCDNAAIVPPATR